MRLHLAAQPAQVQGSIDPAQQMIAWHHIFEIKFIEKKVLPTNRLAHHRFDPLAAFSLGGNHSNSSRTKDFFNSLSHKEKSVLPQEVEHQPQKTLRQKRVKIGARVMRQGRYVTFQLAEVATSRALFGEILRLETIKFLC